MRPQNREDFRLFYDVYLFNLINSGIDMEFVKLRDFSKQPWHKNWLDWVNTSNKFLLDLKNNTEDAYKIGESVHKHGTAWAFFEKYGYVTHGKNRHLGLLEYAKRNEDVLDREFLMIRETKGAEFQREILDYYSSGEHLNDAIRGNYSMFTHYYIISVEMIGREFNLGKETCTFGHKYFEVVEPLGGKLLLVKSFKYMCWIALEFLYSMNNFVYEIGFQFDNRMVNSRSYFEINKKNYYVENFYLTRRNRND